jgi:hypothetical protein
MGRASKGFKNKFMGRKKGQSREKLMPKMASTNGEQLDLVADKADPSSYETPDCAIDIVGADSNDPLSASDLSPVKASAEVTAVEEDPTVEAQQTLEGGCASTPPACGTQNAEESTIAESKSACTLDAGQTALLLAVLVSCVWTYTSEANGAAQEDLIVENRQHHQISGGIQWEPVETRGAVMGSLSPIFPVALLQKSTVITSKSARLLPLKQALRTPTR